MKKNEKLLVTLSLSTFLALNVIAEEKTDLGVISVTDSALESQIKSITSEKLDNTMATDIKDILKSMPSVSVAGNSRYSQKVYVRGLEDAASNITIDGAKMSGQLFHHSGTQTVDAETLKIGSIELGPNSALSGSGVINGSFVYETKDPSDYLADNDNFGGKIGTAYESAYSRRSIDASIFGKVNDKFELALIANKSEDKKIETPDSEDITTKQSDLESILLKVIYKPNDNNKIKLSYNSYEDAGDRQLSGEKSTLIDSDTVYNEISRKTFTLNHSYSAGNDLINLESKIYTSSQDLSIESMKDTSYWTYGDKADEGERTFSNENQGADLRNTSFINNHKLTYGVAIEKEEQSVSTDGDSVYTSGSNIGDTYSITDEKGKSIEYSAYIEDEINFDNLVLNLGLRYDKHILRGLYTGTNSQLSPKFKGKFQATDNFSLRAAYGRIFKGPSLGETLYLSDTNTVDKDLKAQTGNNYELGFDYDLSKAFNTKNSILGFTVYKYNVDGYMDPSKMSTLANFSDIKMWGVESIFRYETQNLSFSISHTYNDGDAEVISTGSKYNPSTAKIHTVKIDTDYKYNANLSFNYNAEFVRGNKYDYYFNEAFQYEVDRVGYSVHNISTTYSPASMKNIKLSLGIDNLFDKQFSTHTTFGTDSAYTEGIEYEAGRNYKVKLTYNF